ncbi:cache domain-containing sensor histidine kinase [Saccharibacillus alkalitolerans]|uniref:HAMP domain-containing protein n=1 Tax=Saccharibacillus alkalitolerans TaxID=2705290 RepID=A0ABX0FEE5_9BACL|nr:histidine kinase [Saccharibacillus alkalitolerans]NGZ77982.1 HAMP domain-containing protein [Saccharibacillus alkalitolerans]
MIRQSIRSKLIVFLVFATALPILLSTLIAYNLTKENVKRSAIEDNASLLFQGQTNIVNYLDTVNKLSLQIYDESVYGDTLIDIILSGSDELESGLDRNDVMGALRRTYYAMDGIYQVFLHIDESSNSYLYYAGKPYGPTRQDQLPEYRKWDMQAFAGVTHRAGSYRLRPENEERSTDVFTFNRIVYDIPRNEKAGLLAIDVRIEFLRSLTERLAAEGEEVYIVDSEGRLIVGPEDRLGEKPELNGLDDVLAAERESGYTVQKDGSDSFLFYEKIRSPLADWTLVKSVGADTLYRRERQILLLNAGVGALSLIVVVVATAFISLKFTQPIRKLIRGMQQVESGGVPLELETNRTDEFGVLSRRFEGMVRRLNDSILKQYRLEIMNKTNQLRALEAQVNPHFLNNALQSIATLALKKGDKEVYGLISSLGRMMHYNMHVGDAFVPLSREIDYVQDYLGLQRHRFRGNFRFSLEVEPEAKNVQVPRMILQPLAENYFKHAGEALEQEGVLRIRAFVRRDAEGMPAWREAAGVQPDGDGSEKTPAARSGFTDAAYEIAPAESERGMRTVRGVSEREYPAGDILPRRELIVIVADNGPGIEPEQRRQLQDMLDRPLVFGQNTESSQIGLRSVGDRLRLYFGESSAVFLSRALEGGLQVTLRIPLFGEEEIRR